MVNGRVGGRVPLQDAHSCGVAANEKPRHPKSDGGAQPKERGIGVLNVTPQNSN
jgi:hypothetical protein